jgi:Flp pilus assembly protein TadD
LGQRKEAEAALLKAQRLDPADPAPPYTLAILYAQVGQRQEALAWAKKLQAINPQDTQAGQLIAKLCGQP